MTETERQHLSYVSSISLGNFWIAVTCSLGFTVASSHLLCHHPVLSGHLVSAALGQDLTSYTFWRRWGHVPPRWPHTWLPTTAGKPAAIVQPAAVVLVGRSPRGIVGSGPKLNDHPNPFQHGFSRAIPVQSWDVRGNHRKGWERADETEAALTGLKTQQEGIIRLHIGSPLWSQLHAPPAQQGNNYTSPSFPRRSRSRPRCADCRHGTERWPFGRQAGAASPQLGEIKARAWGGKKWLSSSPSLPAARCMQTQPEGIRAIEKRWNK